MHQKVLAFIHCEDQWLLLRNSPTFVSGAGLWFTVTGSVENGESNDSAVARETLEETGCTAQQVFDLNWSFIYASQGVDYQESFFLVSVGSKEVTLSSEHTEYRWVTLDEYLNEIWWDADRELLGKVLKSAIQGKQFFSSPVVEDIR